MSKTKKPKILFFDLETSPLQAWVWGCGKQVVRHGQLVKGRSRYQVICITYCWNDGKPAKALVWDYKSQDDSEIIKKFDKIIAKADQVIGKNSDRFDVKQINARRLFNDQTGDPSWAMYTDDLEKQMRKHFYLPSYSLDYLSKELGVGGKISMQFQDWIDIIEQNKNGRKALKKMVDYGKKDVEDTRAIWDYCLSHFTPKLKKSAYYGHLCCNMCGSSNIHKNGTRLSGHTKYQRFHCSDCGRHAGRASIGKNGKLGKMQ